MTAKQPSSKATPERSAAIGRFQTLLQLATISRDDPSDTDWPIFEQFLQTVTNLYPKLSEQLEFEAVAEHTLLYRWRGKDSTKSIVLMAHYDVVAATSDGWDHPPFEAKQLNYQGKEVIFSRGSIDNKGAAVALFEAVETLLNSNYQPQHDIYLSFGHDEETHGTGAQAVVELLKQRGVQPELVLDEGGAIVEGVFPGLKKPAAMVGVAEKGILNLKLEVVEAGGHASTPPDLSATAQLARAILRINNKPFPASLTEPSQAMMKTLGAHTPQPYRFLFTQQWLTKPLLVWLFKRLSNETKAVVRTTTATTQLSGSLAHNALPEVATANVNIRVKTGETIDWVVSRVKKIVNDPEVKISAHNISEPSPVSPSTGSYWQLLADSITENYPEVIVSPYVQLGASDSRYFTKISDRVYRFTPFELSTQERAALHAMNERIGVRTWLQGIEFFKTFIQKL